MKLHDLRPAPGSTKERTRAGRGIAAGKGKTAGRGTKGQKQRAGGSIPAGFEGGQTPIHRRVPKLHGFKNKFRIEYEIVNIGRVSEYAEQGRFAEAEAAMAEAGLPVGAPTGKGRAAKGAKAGSAAPLTVNAELLHAVGLIRTLRRPVKVLGQGEVARSLFVVADAFTKSARTKIEAAGGTAQVLEIPIESLPALGLEPVAGEAAPAVAAETPEETPTPTARVEPAKATTKAAKPVAKAAAKATTKAAKPVAKAAAKATTAEAPAAGPAAKQPAKPAPKRAAAPAKPPKTSAPAKPAESPAKPAGRSRKQADVEPAE